MLRCIDCNEEFIFTAGEQFFFSDKGLKNDPKRCKTCKAKKNERIAANSATYRQSVPRERVEVTVKCALCAVETTVPFRPTQNRPVYCRDCFLRMRVSKSSIQNSLP
ncbi:MAG TPA: zinc-ribbon domain containing protein [Blastocatellia bacterium]|nr:zinc-ribbon domain containing protein [Blastocatellia bacterium]